MCGSEVLPGFSEAEEDEEKLAREPTEASPRSVAPFGPP